MFKNYRIAFPCAIILLILSVLSWPITQLQQNSVILSAIVSIGVLLLFIYSFLYFYQQIKSTNIVIRIASICLVIAFPLHRLTNGIIGFDMSHFNEIVYYLPTFCLGIVFVFFSIGLFISRIINSKSTIAFGISSLITGLAYMSHIFFFATPFLYWAFYGTFVYTIYIRNKEESI